MNATAVLTIVGLVLFATLLGLLWRWRSGRVETSRDTRVDLPEISADASATLLQFSTAVCAPCKPTRVLLASLADEYAGVEHVDIDLTHRADLAARFNILQTPTTLLLDGGGVVRGRIGGAPRAHDLRAALEILLDTRHTDRTPS